MNISHEAIINFLRDAGVKFFIFLVMLFSLTILIPKIFDHFEMIKKNKGRRD